MSKRIRDLSGLEQEVMEYVWRHGPSAAIACADALRARWPMRDSTVRTVFRRLEAKGYVTHALVGRTYVYSAKQPRQSTVMTAVKQLVDRFCHGSAEALVVGMVEHAVFTDAQLERLAAKIAERKRGKS